MAQDTRQLKGRGESRELGARWAMRLAVAGVMGLSGWGETGGGGMAWGIVWNGIDFPSRGVTSETGLTDRPGNFANVLVVNNTYNSTRGTATYLANGWIITARHVAQGPNYGVLAPSGNIGFNGQWGAMTIPVPYGAEISLVKMRGSVGLSALPSSVIWTGSSETGALVQQGGYGLWGQIGQSTSSAAMFHRVYNISWTSGGFVYTETNGEQRLRDMGLLEGGAMSGDSGSALWLLDGPDSSVNDWSKYKLAGILATSQGNYWGADSQYARVSGFSGLIRDVVWGSDRSYQWGRGIAGTFSWNNTSPNGEVTNGNNWNSSLSSTHPQGAGDKVTLGNAIGGAAQVINLNQNVTVGELTIGNTISGAGTQTLAAGGAYSLTFDNLSAPGILLHTAEGEGDVISAPIRLGGAGDLMISNPSGVAMTLSGTVMSAKTSGTQTVNIDTGPVNFSGNISDGTTGGKVALLVTGGTTTLSGSNSFSGGITVGNTGAVGWPVLLASRAVALAGSNVAGRVVVNDGGTLQLELGGSGWTSAELNAALPNVTMATGSTLALNAAASTTTVTAALTQGFRLVKLGAGTVSLSGSNSYPGLTRIERGQLALTSGQLGTSGANIEVGPVSGQVGMLAVSGGVVNAQRVIIAGNSDNNVSGSPVGTVAHTGGTINAGQWFTVGSGSGSGSTGASGAYQMSGGAVLNVRNTGGGTSMEVGNFAGTTGLVTVGGDATINLWNNAPLRIGANNGASSSGVTQSGGRVVFYGDAGVTPGGTGGLVIGAAGTLSGIYTYTLSGGVLRTPMITRVSGTGNLVMRGGTLAATGSTTNWISNLSAARVGAGGVTVDTGAFEVVVPQLLAHDPALGSAVDGGLRKVGSGVLELGVAPTYTGTTTVLEGTLRVTSGARYDLAGLAVGGGGRVVVERQATADRTVLVVGGVSIASGGRVELGDAGMVVRSGGEAAVRELVGRWWNGGARNGDGLTTTLDELTTLAVVGNNDGTGGVRLTSFEGVAVGASDILVKRTYIGDMDLSGVVDESDLSALVAGLRMGSTGWWNGDTNYDGKVDANDLANLLKVMRLQGAAYPDARGTAAVGGVGAAVPEPAGAGVLLGVSVGVMGRRRRR